MIKELLPCIIRTQSMYYHCYLFIRESTCITEHQNSAVGIHSSYRTIAFSVSYRFPTVLHAATAKHHLSAHGRSDVYGHAHFN